MIEQLQPNHERFAADPFGYSASAWMRWAIAMNLAGGSVDPRQSPTSENLKDPILWLCQAQALEQAAAALLKTRQQFGNMPEPLRGVCDSQYCAVALMLVGYSLEISLKAMIILREGVQAYTADEKRYKHHKLVQLADFIPDLSMRDKAILDGLTHFVTWAGRYPDPGSGRLDSSEAIFRISENHQVAARDLFELAGRVMRHVGKLVP